VTPAAQLKLSRYAQQVGAELDGHGNRVAAMIPPLMAAAGLALKDPTPIVLGARLHDIGKRLVPPDVLSAPRALTSSEHRIIQNHPRDGVRLAEKEIGTLPHTIVSCILHHHERWRGGGYPDGLTGYRIPLAARLVAIADVIDALASPRPYKPGLHVSVIRKILVYQNGKLFDPSLLGAALQQYDRLLVARATAPPPELKPCVQAHKRSAPTVSLHQQGDIMARGGF
jgi:putative two-component system response regulator